MAGYTKLFSSIVASTIWRADDKTRIVWITMLAMADAKGVVEASIPGLADMARVTVDDCVRALDELQQPDEFSRTKTDHGRRIEVVEGGWKLINHGKYREKLNSDARREYLKNKAAEYRKRDKDRLQNVDTVDTKYTIVTQAEAEATPEACTPTVLVAEAKAPRPKRQGLTDEWLIEIKPTYPDIDVRSECQKMTLWCSVKGKQPSRSRLINWLNRIEKPATTNGSTKGASIPKEKDYSSWFPNKK